MISPLVPAVGGIVSRDDFVRQNGSGAGDLIKISVLATLSVTSWALRPQSRMLGTLFPAKASA